MNLFKKQNKIFAIGDLASEFFIGIEDADILYNKESNDSQICLPYGGKIPYKSLDHCRAVGNSANFAIGASRLGVPVSLLSYVGDDLVGSNIIDELKKEKIDISNIEKVPNFESNVHFVLNHKGERTILVKHQEFPYSFPKNIKADWLYLSSLASNSLEYHQKIINFLKNNKDVKLVFQPGTFQIKIGYESLKEIYENTEVFISNKEEAERILGVLEMPIPDLLKKIYSFGPKIVVITDSINGSYCYNGKEVLYMNSLYKKEETVESTGAGDAFSAGFVSALFFGKDLKEALSWGTINAKEVVSFVGPQKGLVSFSSLGELLKKYSPYLEIKII